MDTRIMDHLLQPDQDPVLWDRYVAAYEATFEPLSNQFAAFALDGLGTLQSRRFIDIGAGTGGAALIAAERGADVLAIDASPAMVARIAVRARAVGFGARVSAHVMDALSLEVEDQTADVGLSCFGVILLPDPVAALREIRRVLRPGGDLLLVTWTEPESYELAARLRHATVQVCGNPRVPTQMPAQLRYADPRAFSSLVVAGGFTAPRIERVAGRLGAASASALTSRLAFAPGLGALLGSLGPRRDEVLDAFAARLAADQGPGPVSLGAVAQIARARRPHGSDEHGPDTVFRNTPPAA